MVVVQTPDTRYAGLAWLAIGFAGYAIYRRRIMRISMRETVKAPPAFGPALALEYRRLLVPVVSGQPSDDAMDVACSLAAERGAQIVALTVVEVPRDLSIDTDVSEDEWRANRELDEAAAIGGSYGVKVVGRLLRARNAGEAIVAEATARDSEIIVLGSPRKRLTKRQAAVFGETVDYVLRHAPCRVMVTASLAEAA